jgi:opacity protein-like surface antigen
MKKQFLAALVILCTAAAIAQTAPEKKESKFEFLVNGKLGFARLKQTNNVPLNGNVNGSDLLLAYKLGPRWNIATGIGLLQLDANPTIAGNTASIRNSYLQIPVRFTGDYNLFHGTEPTDPKMFFSLGLGVYANTLLKQELETVAGNTDTHNLGWNFGFATAVGVKFVLTDALNVGLGIENQSEFTKMKKGDVEQRIEQMNTLYFKLGFKF